MLIRIVLFKNRIQFLWRVLQGVLPMRIRLQDRGVSHVQTSAFFAKQIMRMIGIFL